MSDSTLRKSCSRCKLTKPADEFSPNRQDKSGLASRCKSCHREHASSLRYDVDPTLHEKCCAKCKSVKPVDQFSRNVRNKSGLQSACRFCQQERHRDWYVRNSERVIARTKLWAINNPEKSKDLAQKRARRRIYGLPPKEYDQLLKSQGEKCAGCGDAFNGITPQVDHDHETAEVRGLLCGSCNKTLGMAMDSTERLLGLVRYLRRSRLQIVASGD